MEILTLCLALVFGNNNYHNVSGTVHDEADRNYMFQVVDLDILPENDVNSVSFLVDGELIKHLTLAEPYWETPESYGFPIVFVNDWRDLHLRDKPQGFTTISINMITSVVGKRFDLIIDGEVSRATVNAIYAVPEPPSILVLLMFIFIYYCVRT